jgi:hypothetical protein
MDYDFHSSSSDLLALNTADGGVGQPAWWLELSLSAHQLINSCATAAARNNLNLVYYRTISSTKTNPSISLKHSSSVRQALSVDGQRDTLFILLTINI